MKNIWRIYKTDWINIAKVPVGIFMIIALALLPSIYSWVNLYSVWDPYANTSGITVAVTNEDEGTIMNETEINIGQEVLESLKENRQLGWTFVDREQARRGVERGDYYASLMIPADFSSKLVSIATGRVERPTIEYTVNEKINAVAPKITGSGASTLTSQLNENFIRTVSETVLEQLQEVGIEIEKELPTIRKVEHAVLTLEESLPHIDNMAQSLLEMETKLPELHDKAQTITVIEENIPGLYRAGETILHLEEQWPHITEAADRVVELQQKIPEIQQLLEHFGMLVQHFDQAEEVMTGAISRTEQAAHIVNLAQQAIPDVRQLVERGDALSSALEQYLTEHEDAFALLPGIIKQNLLLMRQTSQSVSDLTGMLMEADVDPEKALPLLNFTGSSLAKGAEIAGHTSELLHRLNTHLQSPILDNWSEWLHALQSNMEQRAEVVQKISYVMERGEKPARELIMQLDALSQDANRLLDRLLLSFDAEIVPAVEQAINTLVTRLGTASDVMQSVVGNLDNLEEILNSAQSGIQYGLERLSELQQDLPAIGDKLEQVYSGMQDKLDLFMGAVNTAVPFMQNELPEIEQRLHQAADFVRNDLPQVEEHIHRLSDFVQHRLPELERIFGMSTDFMRNDLPEVEDAVRKAADRIRQLQGKEDALAELAAIIRGDIAEESDFLSQPVQIQENRLYPIPNYGSAMAPFYSVLSIWVGSTLLISLLKTEVENPNGVYRPRQMFIGRWLTFLTIGVSQALIMALGNIYLLNIYAVHPGWFVVFAVCISLLFITITYSLLAVFGNIGKGIAIIFMVLQFSSSGGTFPVATTAPIFQALNPYMPFTYAISLLREAVGGIYTETVTKDIVVIMLMTAICLALAFVLRKPLSGITKRSAEQVKRTKIMS
ncbi:YhgE/Pip domain-containing protein [Xylanibacillus composti]|uniref:Phage infection protein n=1 Tax=Xylanibacillus composti TaxID=1572762 RepID=A0A8J4H2W2_9BACL|nr:YhgE/Pip domain-containing protein [Xylanibacillus composti]MDT9723399.1 YhgE/Pip domain-containing protein [Xylanibacillus composti]GIQ68566.1 phage infection protein [Xylanibacillus composti]